MKRIPELVVMLTHNDRTVPDAIEVFEAAKDSKAKFWGFKEIGLPEEKMKILVDKMKAAGKTTFLEVVDYTEEGCVEGAKIGASAVVLKEVPPHCTVVGNPGRIVRQNDERVTIDLDHVHMPDPVKERILALEGRLTEMEACRKCEQCPQCETCQEPVCMKKYLEEEVRNEDL